MLGLREIRDKQRKYKEPSSERRVAIMKLTDIFMKGKCERVEALLVALRDNTYAWERVRVHLLLKLMTQHSYAGKRYLSFPGLFKLKKLLHHLPDFLKFMNIEDVDVDEALAKQLACEYLHRQYDKMSYSNSLASNKRCIFTEREGKILAAIFE